MSIEFLPVPMCTDEKTGATWCDGVGLYHPNGVYLHEGIGQSIAPLAQVIVKGPVEHGPADYAAAASEKLGRQLRVKATHPLRCSDPVKAAQVRDVGFLSIILEPAI